MSRAKRRYEFVGRSDRDEEWSDDYYFSYVDENGKHGLCFVGVQWFWGQR